MTKKELKGILPISPPLCIKDNGVDIDFEMIAECIKYLHKSEIHGFIILGSMGHDNAVTESEYNQVVDTAVDATQGSQVCIIGNAQLSTREAVRRARYAEDAGADGIMLSLPFTSPLTWEEAAEHYRTVNDALDELQILVYNFPPTQRGFVITPEFWDEVLLKLDHVKATKDSSFKDSMHRIRTLRRISKKINVVYTGSLAGFWDDVALGANSVLAIREVWWMPKFTVEFYKGCIEEPNPRKRSERLKRMYRDLVVLPGYKPFGWPGLPPGPVGGWSYAAMASIVNFTTEWTECRAGPPRKPYTPYPLEALEAFNADAQKYVDVEKKYFR